MAENQTPTAPAKSKRDLFGERLKKKYPDRDYADDEALFGQINDDYDQYDNELGQYKERESRLTDLLSKDNRAAQFIADMAKGNDPWLAVIERLGIDGITDLMNDPSKQEAYAEANKKYVERLAKEKSLEEEYEKNMKEVTLPMLERMKQERGISDDMIDAAWDYLHHVADAAEHYRSNEKRYQDDVNPIKTYFFLRFVILILQIVIIHLIFFILLILYCLSLRRHVSPRQPINLPI